MVGRRFLVLLALAAAVCVGAGGAAWHYLRGLDALVVEKFTGRRWNFPSRIYADAFFVYPGVTLQAAGFFDRLRRLNYREVDAATLRKGDWRRTPGGIDLFLRDFTYPGQRVEDRLVHLALQDGVVVRMTDLRSGEELYSLPLEPEVITGLYDTDWEERREVTLSDVPPLLVRAILLTEDRRFFSHEGFDALGILRALLANLRSGEIVQGGSTLTQQLMKNFFLSEERTMHRKIVEALMAVLAERRYAKEEILENYLNEIYLGQNGLQGIFGVWEASQFYFARSPHELSVAETALLAGLIRAPNAYSPYRHPERATERRATVLRVLREAGAISAPEHTAAMAEPLRVTPLAGGRNAAPYFVDFLQDDLTRHYPRDVLTAEGLGIFTSLDVHRQKIAERVVADGVADLERRYPALADRPADRRVQAALLALRPQTGEIVAMVGGRSYETSQFNRAVQAKRQPGSVFKPFVYLAAFEAARDAPDPITPATTVVDEPFEWQYEGRAWEPANYRDVYLGQVTVRRALEYSLNAATARIAHRVGLDPIRDLAAQAGLATALPLYPAMVLGAVELSPFEVAQAYATIANQGLRAAVRAANKVVDRHGQVVERRPVEVVRAASPEAAHLLTHVLEGVLERGTGRGARELGFTRPAAGKTGTTNDARDAWFAGFTPELLAVVWVGFDDGEPLGLTGAEAALPIWTAFMQQATAAYPVSHFHPPAGVALVRIDPYTGGIATSGCPDPIVEAFWRGQEPTTACPLHSPSVVSPPAGSRPVDAGSGLTP